MPFKPVEHPKCPKCAKSVYAAEERVAGGHKFHKGCFKCGMCNKALDSTNCCEHETELYCKSCHGRKYGPKGYGFGGGAGALSMDTGAQFGNTDFQSILATPAPGKLGKAPEGEGCPRCGGFVYAAEQMLSKGRMWHRCCFKCTICKKPLDSMLACDGPDKDIYCKTCYGKKYGPKGYGYGKGAGILQCDQIDAETPYVKPVGDPKAIIKPQEGQTGCPRCGGAVFAAELVLAKGREWHRHCFKCTVCIKQLDSIIACDGPDGDVYCRTCYGKKYGPKGYGFSCGAGFLQTDVIEDGNTTEAGPALRFLSPDTTSIKAGEGEGCPRCGGKVFAAEQMLAKSAGWHKKCFNCADCHRPLDSILACDGPDKEIYCRGCYGKHYGPKGFGYGACPTLKSTSADSTAPPYNEPRPTQKVTEGEGCGRCGCAVYAAEMLVTKKRMWHKRCFACKECNRGLDSTTVCDGPDLDIYCKGCYARNFGPKGVGFGMGAGVLSMV